METQNQNVASVPDKLLSEKSVGLDESVCTKSEKNIENGDNVKQLFTCKICGGLFYKEFLYKNHIAMHEHVMNSIDDIAVANLSINDSNEDDCKDYSEEEMRDDSSNDDCNKSDSVEFSISSKGERITRTCQLCGMIFESSYTAFKTHIKSHKNKCCKKCNKSFQNYTEYIQHKKLVHSQEEYYACNVCGKLLSSEYYVKHHIKRVHGVETEKVVCDKIFADSKELKINKNIVLGNTTNRKLCTQCNKTFKNSQVLMDHVRRCHSNSNYNMCEICGHRVKSISEHLRNVHGDPVPCDICGKFLSSRKMMLVHRQATHRDERNWTCEVCGKSFKRGSGLRKHEKVHEDERKFECDICHKTFKFNSVLRTHRRVHSDTEPYKCDKCDEHFKWKQTYDKHVKLCSQNDS